MNSSTCPWCYRWYSEEKNEELYWHIKVHNAQEEAQRLLEEKHRRDQNKEVSTSEA